MCFTWMQSEELRKKKINWQWLEHFLYFMSSWLENLMLESRYSATREKPEYPVYSALLNRQWLLDCMQNDSAAVLSNLCNLLFSPWAGNPWNASLTIPELLCMFIFLSFILIIFVYLIEYCCVLDVVIRYWVVSKLRITEPPVWSSRCVTPFFVSFVKGLFNLLSSFDKPKHHYGLLSRLKHQEQ